MKLPVLCITAILALMMFPLASYAEHPDNDVIDRDVLGQLPDPEDPGYQDPTCDQENPFGLYDSLDGEWWQCIPDPDGVPGVPGSGGSYWEPDEGGYGDLGGDVKFAVKWGLTNIPGVSYRLSPRTEWLNTTGAGRCPNVTGGCKLKGGADIHLVNSNRTPHPVPYNWLNNAKQLYVYNSTSKTWALKSDTGWRMPATSGTVSKVTTTANWGTAPYGAAYYQVIGWERTWNGTAWSTSVSQTSGSVWDDKPGDNAKKPKKPKNNPKLTAPANGALVTVG